MRRDPFQFEPGRTLGRYELLAPIGLGDTPRIWAARESGTVGFEELVALRAFSSVAQEEHAFQLEAELASRIQHRNVARCLDTIRHEGVPCSIMEWIDGRSLADVLRASSGDGPLPLGLAVQIIVQACEGLKAVHGVRGPDGRELNWIHGDVSPHSLMIDTAGTVKLVDLGIVRKRPTGVKNHAGELTEPSFVAPELARGERVDVRADVFSLGVIFYRLTTGRHPLPRSRGSEQSAAGFGDSGILPPSTLVRGYPKALEAWVLRALARERERRFRSIGEMLDGLLLVFPGYASEGELAALLRRLCGDSILGDRRQIEKALERYSVTDSTRFPRPEMPTSEITSNTLSPSYFATEAAAASPVPWKASRLALAVASVAFVTAFALTVVLSSFRSLRSAPAAQAVTHGAPSPAASAHSNPSAESHAESALLLVAPVVPQPATTLSSTAPATTAPATTAPATTAPATTAPATTAPATTAPANTVPAPAARRKAPTKGSDSDAARRYGI